MADLPKKGKWIMIIKTVPVLDVFAPLYSIWYALPTKNFSLGDENLPNNYIDYENMFPFRNLTQLKHFITLHKKDKNILDGDEKKTVETFLDKHEIHRQVKILTPFGTVLLQPNEYNVVDFNSYLECIDTGSYQVKFLSGGVKIHKNTARDQLLYIRSRGISLSTALGMVSGLISSQNTLYMLPHPEYQKMFLSWWEVYFEQEKALKTKKLKLNENNEEYFFNEEEALKINNQYYRTKK
jgi:hypothetical protein